MKVANAIYDVVFKYLMEDKRIAKLLLSALLKMEIEELELQPQEYTTDAKNKTLTIYRMDFKAKIRFPNDEKKIVLIELQKAKFPSDIMRFRKYLGEQYSLESNVSEEINGKKEAIPIITIYFLGYPLNKYTDRTIIRVKRKYFDDVTEEELLDGPEPFIENLTHDSIIIQVGAIKNKKHRSRLEKVLSVFDSDTKHGIEINEDEYPEEYKIILRRLIKAYVDEHVRKTMDIEDQILEDIANAERKAQKAEEQAEKAEEKAEKIHKNLLETARLLKSLNIDIDTIAARTGLSKDEIIKL